MKSSLSLVLSLISLITLGFDSGLFCTTSDLPITGCRVMTGDAGVPAEASGCLRRVRLSEAALKPISGGGWWEREKGGKVEGNYIVRRILIGVDQYHCGGSAARVE